MSDNKKMLDLLEMSLAKLQERPMEAKEHYLSMLVMLTDSFLDDSKAQCVLLHRENGRVALCVSNATEADCIDIIQEGLSGMLFRATINAPPRELFH